MERSVIKLTDPDRWLITECGTYKIVDAVTDEDYELWANRELQVLEDVKAVLKD